MKILILFIFLFPTIAFSSLERGPCRYDLVGPETLPDSIIERKSYTHDECVEKARSLLDLNRESYNKALIKNFLTGKWIVIETKSKK